MRQDRRSGVNCGEVGIVWATSRVREWELLGIQSGGVPIRLQQQSGGDANNTASQNRYWWRLRRVLLRHALPLRHHAD
jgi:hypothetical protein